MELEKLAGDPVDVLVNNKPFARGEVVVIDENFGVRVTEIISSTKRVRRTWIRILSATVREQLSC